MFREHLSDLRCPYAAASVEVPENQAAESGETVRDLHPRRRDYRDRGRSSHKSGQRTGPRRLATRHSWLACELSVAADEFAHVGPEHLEGSADEGFVGVARVVRYWQFLPHRHQTALGDHL